MEASLAAPVVLMKLEQRNQVSRFEKDKTKSDNTDVLLLPFVLAANAVR